VFAQHIRNSPVFWAKPTPLRLFDFYTELLGHAVLPAVSALACVALAGMVAQFSIPAPASEGKARTQPPHELAAAIGFLFVPVLLLIFTRLRTGYFMDRYALTAVIGVAILAAYFLRSACSWPAAGVFILAFAVAATGLRCMNVLRLIGGLHGHAATVYSPGAIAGFEAIPGDLPIVVSNPMLYLETAHYAGPKVISRMVYLTDLPAAFQQSDPLPEYSLYVARPILPGHTEDYEQFLKEHDRFWLYYSGNPGMEWLPAKLLSAGYGLRAVTQQGNVTVFDVMGAGRLP
jgi:hypothetical protein